MLAHLRGCSTARDTLHTTGAGDSRPIQMSPRTSTFYHQGRKDETMRIYQLRTIDEEGVVLSFIFDLTRREAVSLFWKTTAPKVQMLANRRVIAERS